MSNQDFGHVAGRTMVAAAVGGTASAIGGGKFANGARTAAFAHLLNAENTAAQQRAEQKIQKDIFSLKFHTGKFNLSAGIKNVASFKGSLSINSAEQIDGIQFRTVNGVELSAELRGVEYKAIDLKEYNNSKVLINNSFSKNITVRNFNLSNQDMIFKFDVGGYLFGFDSELNISEVIRRVSD